MNRWNFSTADVYDTYAWGEYVDAMTVVQFEAAWAAEREATSA